MERVSQKSLILLSVGSLNDRCSLAPAIVLISTLLAEARAGRSTRSSSIGSILSNTNCDYDPDVELDKARHYAYGLATEISKNHSPVDGDNLPPVQGADQRGA